jgi:ankyrin repeat protein
MPTVPLPQDPDLGQLRKQARALQQSVRAGLPAALELVAEFHPGPPGAERFPLSAAQLVVARRHRFTSWARLRRHVETVTGRTWRPGGKAPADEPLPDRFLRLACLTYEDDSEERPRAAARLLAEHPELPSASPLVAAACADVAALRAHLAADPDLGARTGGPYGWSPLLYQAYARHDLAVSLAATLETAKLLLDCGADPDDGRLWHGLVPPFTVLTGVFGSGEQDQSTHPHAQAFARLLLTAGADPNDGQALYNRMFGDNDEHLVLLFEFGLGRGDGGPWARLLGDSQDSPEVMLRSLLWWAVTHGQRQRVALLAGHGVDTASPFTGKQARTPVAEALLSGQTEVAADLLALGVSQPELTIGERFIADALAGDEAAARAAGPAAATAARELRPGLLSWVARLGRHNELAFLVRSGFDVNSFGRSDAPADDPWHAPLHVAAGDGDLPLARRLLALGADPSLRDHFHGSTPLGWARHFGHQPLIDLLEPLTREEEQPG